MTGVVMVSSGCRGDHGGGDGGVKRRIKEEEEERSKQKEEQNQQQQQLSMIALVLTALRKSMVGCRMDSDEEVMSAVQSQRKKMEIGWPTDVQHVTHVTFDRFNGFLGLPVEFEVEIPGRVPSASASVFGVSPESMQCCYDSRGNSVPTILLLMQERLYSQGGLKAEGIFRINPENSQEEIVRDQLNKGVVPDDIDVHCLAGLIKAWFRELPAGILDGLSPEEVLQCNTEEECVDLVMLLPPTQLALLNWAVELMADVVADEDYNKMNARNIAMVFAPNMTQMSDPLTALMHAVQVMNLLKTLIIRTLREREEAAMGEAWSFSSPSSSSSPASSDRGADDSFSSRRGADASGELLTKQSSCSDLDSGGREEVHSRDDECDSSSYSSSSSRMSGDESEEIVECFLEQIDWKVEEILEEAGLVGGDHHTGGGEPSTIPKDNTTSGDDNAADEIPPYVETKELIYSAPSLSESTTDSSSIKREEEEEGSEALSVPVCETERDVSAMSSSNRKLEIERPVLL